MPPPSDTDINSSSGFRRQKSPGRKLVEKFTIREPTKGGDNSDGVASGGIIRRHISGGRRKPSLVNDVGIPVASSRKSSISEELLKEEEAIFDSLIMEEIKRTNGVPDRRNSFDGFPSDFGRQSRRKSKRYSVDFNAGERLENSESLNDFIEKLNSDIARSPSGTFSPLEKIAPTIPEETADIRSLSAEETSQIPTVAGEEPSGKEQPFRNLKVNGNTTVDSKCNLPKINYNVIVEESPEPSPDTSFTFVFKKAKEDQRKQQLKQKACETLKTQVAVNDKLVPKEGKSPAKQLSKPAEAVEAKPSGAEKTAPSKDVSANVKAKNIPAKVGKKIQPEKKAPAQPVLKPETRSTEKEDGKKTAARSRPQELCKKMEICKDGSSVGAKRSEKVTDVKCNKNAAKKQPKNAKEKPGIDSKNKGKPTKKEEIKKASSSVGSNKSTKRRSTMKKSVKNGLDAHNDLLSRGSLSKVEGVVENGQDKEETTSKKRREINWKMVDVGRADFDDEITELNGWSPNEDSDSGSVYTSEEDSSASESDSEEETDGIYKIYSLIIIIRRFGQRVRCVWRNKELTPKGEDVKLITR